MKLLLVAQNYHPFVGGVETHVRQLALELRRDHDVAVAAMNFAPSRLPRRIALLHASALAPRHPSGSDGPVPVCSLTPALSERIRLLPIAARTLPGLTRLTGYFRLESFGYRPYRGVYLPRLRRLMRGVEVVHSLAGNYLGWAAREAANELGIPFVSTPFVHPRQWGDGPNDVAYYRQADAVIALVETDREYLVQIGVPAEKIHVIGVSPELPESADAEGFRRKHDLGGAPLVLYVGRMMPQKGARSVLEAAALVWEGFPEARFVFIGPQTGESAAWFRGQDRRVLCLGRVSLQEKADALAACDVFCMPSLSEILPTVYLEAWSCARPVVGGLAHGLTELVEGNEAGLNASQEPAAVAGAILRLFDDPDLGRRLGENGRRLVERNYSVPAVAGALLAIYQRLANQNVQGAVA